MGKDASVPSLCSLGFEPAPDETYFIHRRRPNEPPTPFQKNKNKNKNQFFYIRRTGFVQRSGTCPDMQKWISKQRNKTA